MENRVQAKLARREKVIGTFFTMGNPSLMECLGYSGLDYVIIDTEHGPFDMESTMSLVRAAESVQLTPFVRIGDITHKEIQRLLDLGAQGLIVPLIRTIDEVRQLVALAKFAPIGQRGFIKGRGSGFGYQAWANGSMASFMSACNAATMLLPQCETMECLENIEAIALEPGVDGIFIGPFDLSIALGVTGQFQSALFTAALERILKACAQAGKPAFIFTPEHGAARKYLAQGFDAVACAVDSAVFVEGYRTLVRHIREEERESPQAAAQRLV